MKLYTPTVSTDVVFLPSFSGFVEDPFEYAYCTRNHMLPVCIYHNKLFLYSLCSLFFFNAVLLRLNRCKSLNRNIP